MPQEPIKSFSSQGKIYDIPESQVNDFLKDMPDAKQVVSYKSGNNVYDIPVSETASFKRDMPDARLLHEDIAPPAQETRDQFNPFKRNEYNALTGEKTVDTKPVTLEDSVDKDNEDVLAGIKNLYDNIPYDHRSEQGKRELLESGGNVKKGSSEPAHGISKIIDNAGTIIEALPEAIGKGTIKMGEGLGQAIVNLGGNMRFSPGGGIYSVQPYTKPGERQEQAQATQEISNKLDTVSEQAQNFAIPEYKKHQEEIQKMAPAAKFIGNTLTGMAEFMPAMAAAPATGGTSLFFDGYQSGLDQIKDKDVDPAVKQGYAMLSGGIFSALNAIPIGRALNKKIANKVVGNLAIKSLNKALGDAAGNLSYNTLNTALNEAKTTLADKIKTLGVQGLKNLAESSAFTAANQAADMGLKAGVNKATGQQVFETEKPKNLLPNFLSGVGALGIMQSLLGGYHSNVKNYIRDEVAKANGPEDLANIHSNIDNLQNTGKIPAERAAQLHDAVNNYAAVVHTVKSLPPDRMGEVMDVISDRDNMKSHIQDLQQQLQDADEALKPDIQKQIESAQIAVAAKNDQIREVATGQQYQYIKNDNGYFKKLGDDGQPEPIDKDYYEFQHFNENKPVNSQSGKENNPESANRPEASLDNRHGVGDRPERAMVGRRAGEEGIYRTAEVANDSGGKSPVRKSSEREELESRGINPDWDVQQFRKGLKEEAQKNGVWLDNDYLSDKTLTHDQRTHGTTENDVYVNPDGKTVTKVNNLHSVRSGKHSENLNAFIDRIEAHNALFPDSRYKIKGYMENNKGQTSMVLEQPLIDFSRNATKKEISDYLTDRGFKLDGERDWSNGHEVWSNGRYELYDARPANVVMGKDGKLYFIDAVPHSIEYMSKSNPEIIEKQKEPVKEKGGQNEPVQEQSPDEVDVRQQATDGEGVGTENEKPEKTPENSKPEEEVKSSESSEPTPEEKKMYADAKKMSLGAFKMKYPDKTDQDYYDAREYGVKAVKAPGQSAPKKQYEEVSAKKKTSGTGRIPFKANSDGEPVEPVSKSLERLAKKTKTKFTFMRSGRRNAAGSYSPWDTGIRQNNPGDVDVSAHELGHKLDDQFGVLADVVKNPTGKVVDELNELSVHGSEPPSKFSAAAKQKYRMGEGFAEFLRAHIVNPDEAASRYPELSKLYEDRVPEKYRDAVKEYSDAIRRLDYENSEFGAMTKAFVQMEPAKPDGVMKQIFGNTDYAGDFNLNWLDKLSSKFVDPYTAFKKATEYLKGIKGIDELLPADDPYLLARLLSGESAKFKDFMDNGIRDAKGQPLTYSDGTPMTLKNLFGFAKGLTRNEQAKLWDQVVSHMIFERTVELAKKLDRKDTLTGIGFGLVRDLDAAKNELKKFEFLPEETKNRIMEGAKRYREFADATLKYLVDKGRMSKEQYKLIKDNNVQYVALQRVIKAGADEDVAIFNTNKKTGKLGIKTEVIKAIKGSGREIKNPYISLLDNLHKTIIEADRNEAMQAFVKLLDNNRDMYDGSPITTAEIGKLASSSSPKPPNSLTVFVDGKPQTWVFNKDIYEALKGYIDSPIGRMTQMAGKMTAMLRFGITHFPTFAVRNVVRDFQDYMIKSNRGLKPSDYFGDKSDWSDLAAIGGLNSGYYVSNANAYYGAMRETMEKLANDKSVSLVNMDKLKRLWHGYEDILSRSETRGRVAQYRASFRKAKNELGYDDYNAMLYAGYHSRDLMDFALMGSEMRWLNKWIPFSNAAVQGLRASFKNAKENPLGFSARLLTYSVLPQAALWFWNHRTHEIAKRYEDLPDWRRDLYYNIWIGRQWITIPKPYELGMMGAGIDRGLSKATGYNKKAYDGYAGQVFESISPVGDWAAVLGPLATESEVVFNKDLFRGKEIVPDYELSKPVEERNNEYSSRFGLAVQKVAGIDARYVDFMVRNHFGYYGNTALKLSNVGRSGDDGVQFGLSDIGFFRGPSGTGGKAVQKMREYAHDNLLTSTKEYREFNEFTRQYFNPDLTSKQRAEISDQMAEKAQQLLDKWKSEEQERKERRSGKKPKYDPNKIVSY